MLRIRAEREVQVKDFCEIKTSVMTQVMEKPYASGNHNSNDFIHFESFYVVKDNVFGNKSMCVVIPFKHSFDKYEYGMRQMSKFLEGKNRKSFVFNKKTLTKMTCDVRDHYPEKSVNLINSAIGVINKMQDIDCKIREIIV